MLRLTGFLRTLFNKTKNHGRIRIADALRISVSCHLHDKASRKGVSNGAERYHLIWKTVTSNLIQLWSADYSTDNEIVADKVVIAGFERSKSSRAKRGCLCRGSPSFVANFYFAAGFVFNSSSFSPSNLLPQPVTTA